MADKKAEKDEAPPPKFQHLDDEDAARGAHHAEAHKAGAYQTCSEIRRLFAAKYGDENVVVDGAGIGVAPGFKAAKKKADDK